MNIRWWAVVALLAIVGFGCALALSLVVPWAGSPLGFLVIAAALYVLWKVSGLWRRTPDDTTATNLPEAEVSISRADPTEEEAPR